MFFLKRIKILEETVQKQGEIIAELSAKAEELGKRTISQKTTERETPPCASQILDEWLNGAEDENGN